MAVAPSGSAALSHGVFDPAYFRMSLGMCWPNQDRPSLAMLHSSLTSRMMGSTVASGSVSRLTMVRAAERWMRLARRLSCFSLAAVVMLAMGV